MGKNLFWGCLSFQLLWDLNVASNQVSWEPGKDNWFAFSITSCWGPSLCQHWARSHLDVSLPTKNLWSERRLVCTRYQVIRFDPSTALATLHTSLLTSPIIIRGRQYYPHFINEKTAAEREQRLTQVSHQVSGRVGTWAQVCALPQCKAKQV